LKIRIRERLRQQLERSAKEQEIPLTHEIVRRLENSFEQQQNADLLAMLLAAGPAMELLKAIATVLSVAGDNWYMDPLSHEVAGAINKIVGVCIGDLPAIKAAPDHVPATADGLASIGLSVLDTGFPRSKWGPRK
jgi:hypothetical protein